MAVGGEIKTAIKKPKFKLPNRKHEKRTTRRTFEGNTIIKSNYPTATTPEAG